MSEPFQQLIERDGIAVVLGVFDALTAKIAEDAGFEALYLGGYVVGSSIAPSLIRVDMLYEFIRHTDITVPPSRCSARVEERLRRIERHRRHVAGREAGLDESL